MLDTSERLHEFSQWAGFYKLRQRRIDTFNRLSQERIAHWRAERNPIRLERREPVIESA